MPAPVSSSTPRERILSTAMDLFYRQGYHATGINQIISAAGVARASFYDHFESKEELQLVYASEMARTEIADIRNTVMALPTAKERFFGPLGVLQQWFEATDYRGCPFQNIMAEVPPEAMRVQAVARQHRESIRAFCQELAAGLKNAEKAFSHIDPQNIAVSYMILFEGTIATCVAYREVWPIEQARQILHTLLAAGKPASLAAG